MDVGIYSFPVFTKTCPLFLSRTEVNLTSAPTKKADIKSALYSITLKI
jgi:hypothetical protein